MHMHIYIYTHTRVYTHIYIYIHIYTHILIQNAADPHPRKLHLLKLIHVSTIINHQNILSIL